MFQITKNEPDYFKKAKLKVKNPNESNAWSDENIGNIRTILRTDILRDEQDNLCAYCEKSTNSDSSHSGIDHYKTRNLFPRDTLNYENLLVSCKSKISCEHIKDNYGLKQNDYQNIINPIIENPDDYFDYGLAGDILVKNALSQSDKIKAEFTIKVFALDNKSLTKDRAKISSYLLSSNTKLPKL